MEKLNVYVCLEDGSEPKLKTCEENVVYEARETPSVKRFDAKEISSNIVKVIDLNYNGFYLEFAEDDNGYEAWEAWLCQKGYGEKKFLVGVPKSSSSLEGFIALMIENLESEDNDYSIDIFEEEFC